MDPANVAETYIVVRTVIACSGSMVRVNGRSKAAPVVAPNPGKTPIMTPNMVVKKINNKRLGSNITEPIADNASIIIIFP